MPLSQKTIAIPENRQLDVLSRMLEKKGARVLRCPLVSIHDSPDEQTVLGWMRDFIASPADDLIILTGEGIRRLSALAQRKGLLKEWTRALDATRTLARGPKPGKALRELGLKVDILAAEPTTQGIITTLDGLDLNHRSLAVQLYGDNPNTLLMDYLASRGITPSCVAPYVYATESESEAVVELIHNMANHEVDMICFTSQPQLKRLLSVAKKCGLDTELAKGMATTQIAAVGPVMAGMLEAHGYSVSIQPRSHFFMGDLVKAMVQSVATGNA